MTKEMDDLTKQLLEGSETLEDAQKAEAEIMAKVNELAKSKDVNNLMSLIILNWRIYQMIHNEMQELLKSKGVSEMEMGFLMQAISHGAMKPFKVGRVKNDVKRLLVPFLKSQATKVAKALEEKPGDADNKPEPDGPGEGSGPQIIVP